jgi:hypothetical protein
MNKAAGGGEETLRGKGTPDHAQRAPSTRNFPDLYLIHYHFQYL